MIYASFNLFKLLEHKIHRYSRYSIYMRTNKSKPIIPRNNKILAFFFMNKLHNIGNIEMRNDLKHRIRIMI